MKKTPHCKYCKKCTGQEDGYWKCSTDSSLALSGKDMDGHCESFQDIRKKDTLDEILGLV